MNKFSERFVELRNKKCLSRKQVADILFVSVRIICHWENGKKECNFDMLIKIADMFGVSIDCILGRTEF